MIFIHREKKLPLIYKKPNIQSAIKDLQRFYQSPKNYGGQKRFSFKKSDLIFLEILEDLGRTFNGKCAYCERKIWEPGPAILDFFRPRNGAKRMDGFDRSHYGWLAFEWRNLYMCCVECSRFKENWFPLEKGTRAADINVTYEEVIKEKNLLIDPCLDNPEDHLKFDNHGRVRALSPKGEITIDILKLNRPTLVKDRRTAIFELIHILKKLRSRKVIDEHMERIFSVMADNSPIPFAAAQRQLIAAEIKFTPHFKDLMIFHKPSGYYSTTYSWLIYKTVDNPKIAHNLQKKCIRIEP